MATGVLKVGDILTARDVAGTIDHSLLRPDITVAELLEGCALARQYGCVSVCVRPSDLALMCAALAGSDVLVTTVAAFPHGVATTETKLFEVADAADKGAVEVDMVMNYARFLSGEEAYVEDEIARAVQVAHDRGAKLKVIFENHYLTPEQIRRACILSERAGVDFVKTSTGYAPTGATPEDLRIMRASCTSRVRVKAAGGVRDLADALAVMAAGAVRIGTRATVEIMQEARRREADGTLVVSDEGKMGDGY